MGQKAKCLGYPINSGLLFSIGLLLPGHQPCSGLLLSFLFAHHPLFYWDIIHMQHCVGLRCIMWSFDTCIYCKILTMTRLVNTSFTSHNYHCVVVMVTTLKFYSPGNFQVYNRILVAIVTMLCIRSPELTPFIIGSLSPVLNISSFPPPSRPHCPLTPGNHHSLCCYKNWLLFLDSIYKWDHMVFRYLSFSVWLISLSIMSSRFICVVGNGKISFCF